MGSSVSGLSSNVKADPSSVYQSLQVQSISGILHSGKVTYTKWVLELLVKDFAYYIPHRVLMVPQSIAVRFANAKCTI